MVAIAGTGWTLAPSLVAYVKEADRYYPQRDRESDGSIGDLAHQARVSDHNPDDGWVHAVDLDEDLAPGLDLEAFAEKLRRRRDPRIKYVIYEGRMFSSYATSSRAAWAWGPYSGINAHLHHLHLSILHTDAARNNLTQWGFAPLVVPKPPPEPEREEDDMATSYAWFKDPAVPGAPVDNGAHLYVLTGAIATVTTKESYEWADDVAQFASGGKEHAPKWNDRAHPFLVGSPAYKNTCFLDGPLKGR